MQFEDKVQQGHKLLVEGSMYDRLKRSAGAQFDAQLDHIGLIYSEQGVRVLQSVYDSYVQAATRVGLPILLMTPTWRANQERVQQSTLRSCAVNADAAEFLIQLRDSYDPGQVFVGGLVGCKHDCYRPDLGLEAVKAREFHAPQIEALAATHVDFLFASTLPAIPEAIGLAQAMAATRKPYILSFVADSQGLTLDGIPLAEATKRIDDTVSQRPLGYFVNCTHPGNLLSGLDGDDSAVTALRGRLIGFQGNTSTKDPRALDQLTELETQSPDAFARATIQLREKIGINLLGGCCGTGPEHIEAIGSLLKEADRQS
jgi:homocysteine S-methyltransferase